MTDKQAVPLLTAKFLHEYDPTDIDCRATLQRCLNAIASGDAQVIPRITREALRGALREALGSQLHYTTGHQFFDEVRIIAALKRLGIEVGE